MSPDMADPFLNVLQREAFEQVDEIIGQLPSAAQRCGERAGGGAGLHGPGHG